MQLIKIVCLEISDNLPNNKCHDFSECSILKKLTKTIKFRVSNCTVKGFVRYNEIQGSDCSNKLLFTNAHINKFLTLVFNDSSILLRLCNRINGIHRTTVKLCSEEKP